jgi:hypothetical protein
LKLLFEPVGFLEGLFEAVNNEGPTTSSRENLTPVETEGSKGVEYLCPFLRRRGCQHTSGIPPLMDLIEVADIHRD